MQNCAVTSKDISPKGDVFAVVKDNPQLCWGERKSFSVAYENKTPFDIIKMRLPTASNKSKGGHSK